MENIDITINDLLLRLLTHFGDRMDLLADVFVVEGFTFLK